VSEGTQAEEVDSDILAGESQHFVRLTEKEEAEEKRNIQLAERARKGEYDEDLILEQLARNRVFLSDEGLTKLRSSFVIVVGCGGVGSHAVAALARSGVGIIRLVDFDQVTLSSLNRHAVATLADVGTPKVQAIRRRLEQVAPWIHFDCKNELFGAASAPSQLADWEGRKPDYIVDAIDNIDSKVELLKYCYDNKLPVVSSMGAGCKSDPTRIFLGDISQSTEDPLSRTVRRRLRLLGITSGIPTVFSTEKSAPGKAQLLPLPEDEFQKGKVNELSVLQDFRVRILPVLGTMPAMFGLCVANHIMLELTDYPHEYLLSKGRTKMYESVLATLQGIEERLAKWAGFTGTGLKIPITQDDVGYVVEEVYRGRSVVSGLPTRLALIRWGWHADASSVVNQQYDGQKFSKLELNDLVLMTKEEAAVHEREVLKGSKTPAEMYSADVVELVRKRMEEEREYSKFR
jgi:tRNA A37 threonylcarbamoyladenosine dehydratase